MNKFTKEDLMDIAYRGSYDELERDLALQLLDGMEQDPVADVVAWSSPNEERTCDIRWRHFDVAPGPLYTAPPAPVVPPEWSIQDAVKFCKESGRQDAGSAMEAWNACRAAILQESQKAAGASQNCRSNENVQALPGNSPATPDSWIPVSERMPENMDTVLTCNGFDIGHGWWDGESWQEWSRHDTVPGEITHWQPLPEPPVK